MKPTAFPGTSGFYLTPRGLELVDIARRAVNAELRERGNR